MSTDAIKLESNLSVGFCGKIPSKGDFVHSSLAQDYSEIWNEWLQSIIGVSREQLGDSWLDEYFTSPIWNFALSAGACGQNPMCGVMMPSVDKVGRYFPFTVAATSHQIPSLSAYGNQDWFSEVGELALSALEPGNFCLDSFRLKIESLDYSAFQQSPNNLLSQEKSIRGRKMCWHIDGEVSQENQSSLIQLLHLSWSKLFGCYSLWWTAGSEKVNPCILVTEGLPEVGRFAAMMDGNWSKWGWQSHEVIEGNLA